jgi:hypothetical protein
MFDVESSNLPRDLKKMVSGKFGSVMKLTQKRSDALIEKLKLHPNDPDLRLTMEMLASNKNLSCHAFLWLFEEENKMKRGETVSCFLASNISLPLFMQKKLLGKSDIVRTRLAFNPAVSSGTLFLLAKEPHDHIRYAVAKNPSTSKKALAILAKDANENVRREVAANTKAPIKCIRALLADDCEYVALTASKHPKAKNLKKLLPFS